MKFFNEDLFMEIFPRRLILEIFPFENFFWRFFLRSFEDLFIEVFFFFIVKVGSLSKGEEDEDGVGVIKIYSRGKNDVFFFFFLKT